MKAKELKARKAQLSREQTKLLHSAGLCFWCRNAAEPGTTRCAACGKKQRQKQRKRDGHKQRRLGGVPYDDRAAYKRKEQELVAYYNAGHSAGECALKFKRTFASMHYTLARLGVRMRSAR